MAVKKDKSGGRDVIVSLITESAALTTGSTVKGGYYAVKTVATSSSALPSGLEPGMVFCSQTAITLASGDSVIPLSDPWSSANMIGFANSKDLSQTKTTFDCTTDADEDSDQRSDGIVARSGNINGIKLNNDEGTSASYKLAAQFIDTVRQTADSIDVESHSTPIVLLAFVYTKTKVSGNMHEVVFLPAMLSSDGESSSYGAATTRQMAYVGCAATDAGTKPTRVIALAPTLS